MNATHTKRPNGRGGIREYALKDGSARWELNYWEPQDNGDVKRVFKRGFPTREEAENALESARVKLREGNYLRETRDTLGSYGRTYIEGLRLKPSTLVGYRRHFRVHIVPALGTMRVSKISKNDLNKLYRAMESNGRRDKAGAGQPSSPSTIRHVHALLVQILGSAVEDGLITKNPALRASPPSLQQAASPELETWSADQMRAFLHWSKNSGDYLFLAWHLLLATGMRRGELLALRWRDIDLERQTIAVTRSYYYLKDKSLDKPQSGFTTPKSGKTRVVDIDQATVAELRAYRKAQAALMLDRAARDSLVLANRFDNALNPERFSQQFRERVIKAQASIPDLPKIHVHALRHTHATLLLTAGKHPKVVQERLGHSTIAITLNTYSHVIPTLQRDAADAMGDLFSVPSARSVVAATVAQDITSS